MIRTLRPVYAALAASTLLLACGRTPERTTPMADADASMSPPSSSSPFSVDGAVYGEDVVRDVERVRAATEEFHDIAAAHAAGYPTTVPGCLENPPEGGMGLHYMHPELMDDHLEVERPEILVYAPTSGEEAELAGVEYIVPYSERGPDEEAPRIFGRALKPSEGLELWYLHVWVWKPNSNGLFADWNPAVEC